MAIPFGYGRWTLAAGAGIAFCAGTLLAFPFPASSPVQGLARITVDTIRTGCGNAGCTSEAHLRRCVEVDAGACPELGSDRIAFETKREPPLGAQVTSLARLSPRLGFRNPGPHQAWDWERPQLRANARLDAAEPRVDHASWLGIAITGVRELVRKRLDTTLSDGHAGVARALILGDGSAVERGADAAIRQAGLSHVLAVSGMHVTLFAGALVALVRRLWLRLPGALYVPARRVGGALGVLLAPLVAALCGGAPSAWRAAWTSTLVFAVEALGHKACPVRVCAFAVAVQCTVDPSAARQPGFVLSVVATMALLTAQQAGGGLWGVVKESTRAWLSTAPFLLWVFGSTSLVALPANVLLLPLGALLIPLAVLHLGAALLGLGAVTAWAFELGSGAFVGASRLLAALDPGLALPPLTALQGLACAALSLTWLTRARLRSKLWASLACVLLAAGAELALRHDLSEDEVRITFLDVGQGDAALVEVGTGETMLMDGGGALSGGPDPGEQAILPLLRGLRVSELEVMVLSHPHPDHYGGLFAVLAGVPVRALWDNGQARAEDASGAASRLLARAEAGGTRVLGPSALCGRTHRLGRLSVEVLAPCPAFDDALGENDNSLVLKLAHGAHSWLLTGDVEHAGELALLRHGPKLRATVLKVPHHGSRTSSSEALLRAVAPEVAVISAGRGNRFGHPHADVESRLQSMVKRVLRIDVLGGVRVRSDGRSLTWEVP